MVDAQTVGVLVTAASVTVAAVYYIFTLRINMRTQQLALKSQEQTLVTRQTELTMQIYNLTRSKEFLDDLLEIENEWSWKDYNDFMKNYGPISAQPKWSKFGFVGATWEQAGILVKHKVLDPEMLYDQWGAFYTEFWEKIEPFVIEYNVKNGGGLFEYAEDLYYCFNEARLRDRVAFKEREAERVRRRKELGLSSRPTYTGDWPISPKTH